jgi:hypothetical protein
MLVYKALYKKMMDDLKDAGMWIDWSEQLKGTHPEVAKYLCDSAKERLEESFPKTYEMFKEKCEEHQGKGETCLNEMVEDHMMDWHEAMLNRIKRHG